MGALMAVIALLTMMYNMADFSRVGPPIGHALLSLGYGFGVAILLIPVRMELELVLLE
jgi:flagellar motor component MotA